MTRRKGRGRGAIYCIAWTDGRTDRVMDAQMEDEEVRRGVCFVLDLLKNECVRWKTGDMLDRKVERLAENMSQHLECENTCQIHTEKIVGVWTDCHRMSEGLQDMPGRLPEEIPHCQK